MEIRVGMEIRDDNKRPKTGKCTNCNRLGYFAKDCGARPRMVTSVNARNPTATRGMCFECGCIDHYKAACPRLIRAPRPGGNRPNQVITIEGGQGRGNNDNQAHGRAFMMGAEEACQDPNSIQVSTIALLSHLVIGENTRMQHNDQS
ncbi:reverse transcriptase domain-containing protein [Tanacetum coccineum]